MDRQLYLILGDIKREIIKDSPHLRFAVFDFDNTCIVNDVQEALLAYLCRNFLLRNGGLLKSPSFWKDKKDYHRSVLARYYELLRNGGKRGYEFAVRALAGFSKKEVAALTRKTIAYEGSVIRKENLFGIGIARGLRLRKKVSDLMCLLHSRKIKIWVLTASAEIVVKTTLAYYKLPARCLGVKIREKNGIFIDSLVRPVPTKHGKVLCIKKYISNKVRPLIGVGDGIGDLPMLAYSGIKAVVGKSSRLARKARKRGWYILNWGF